MKFTKPQQRMLEDIDHMQDAYKEPAVISTGRYKPHSVITLRSLIDKGIIEVSFNGSDFYKSSLGLYCKAIFYARRIS